MFEKMKHIPADVKRNLNGALLATMIAAGAMAGEKEAVAQESKQEQGTEQLNILSANPESQEFVDKFRKQFEETAKNLKLSGNIEIKVRINSEYLGPIAHIEFDNGNEIVVLIGSSSRSKDSAVSQALERSQPEIRTNAIEVNIKTDEADLNQALENNRASIMQFANANNFEGPINITANKCNSHLGPFVEINISGKNQEQTLKGVHPHSIEGATQNALTKK